MSEVLPRLTYFRPRGFTLGRYGRWWLRQVATIKGASGIGREFIHIEDIVEPSDEDNYSWIGSQKIALFRHWIVDPDGKDVRFSNFDPYVPRRDWYYRMMVGSLKSTLTRCSYMRLPQRQDEVCAHE